MTIITNENHVVLDISFIPGIVDYELHGYHLYFPVTGDLPTVGDYYNPNNIA